MYNNTQAGIPGVLPMFLVNNAYDGDANVKLNEDSYDLYVNDDYIGKHTFLVQQEDASAISDFLHQQGFGHVNMEVTGDHIIVHSADNADTERIEKALSVFLKNR
ncbi:MULTISPECIES: hypothetical protein [Bacillaceae]|uniref:Uncharacterized protein n=1 Tax=Evansella alkalicola TaxID=745819 RepID=A0ABS6K0B8_9BACI|nr:MULTISPECIES: hypothetical protein [Bacillaceae]MBU9724294.1 hypothetical protein [Bacillus alkalicola]